MRFFFVLLIVERVVHILVEDVAAVLDVMAVVQQHAVMVAVV